jgi:transcriptional regulator with XRE-family HTH domain
VGIGSAQKQARAHAGMTQEELAYHLNMSRPAVANVERGYRKMPRDVMGKAAETLDDGFYAMETAQEVLGEGWIPVLNNVDLHRSAVKEKMLEEIQEAMDQMAVTSMVEPPGPDRRKEIEQLLLECIDVIVGLNHYVAVLCREYAISWFGIWRLYHKKVRDRGYLKKEDRHLSGSR